MGSLQFAYQGFAKQNYTMLDNLKLGYGGTKTEMQRLVKDAAKLDKSVDANSLSYGNIVQAIHAIQVQTGIYGTTQKEAEKTITGSLNAMKSSWGNLLTAMASGENLDQCIDNMVSSVEIFAGNVMPVTEKALLGLGTVIEKIAPIIADKLPDLAVKLLPPLIKATISLTKGLIKALPNIIKAVFTTVGDIMGEQFPALAKLGDFFEKNGEKIEKFIPILLGLVGAFIAFNKIKSIGSALSGFFGGGKGGENGGDKKGGMFSGLTELAKIKTTTVLKGMANLAIILGGMAILTAAFMAVAPHLAKIGDTGSFIKMALFITVLGGVGTALAKFGEIAGQIQVSTVVKGLANMAIMVGGMSALFLLVGAVSLIKIDYGRVLALVGVIGLLGLVGGALAILGGIVGLIPVAVVALGLANMAIIIAGMSALVLLIGAVSLLDFNYGRMFKLVGLIGVLGLVGGALTVFAGIVGMIPTPVVLAGLANIALVLGGVTALIVAYGALSEVKGFTEFIEKGGAILAKIFGVIGECVGSIIGGVGKGLTNALPGIGENISKFAETLRPMCEAFSGIDMGGIGEFFKAIGGFLLQMAGNKILEFFTGSPDFSGVAKGLGTFAESEGVTKFFTMVNGIQEGAFEKGKRFFECLDGISNLPNTGGFANLFGGKNDFSGVATGLGDLATEGVKNFFAMVGGLNETSFENAELFFEALDGISKLPNKGGIGQWFSGENDFSGVAEGLKAFTSKGVKEFFTMVNSLNLGNLNGLWDSLKNAGKLTTKNLGHVIDDSIADLVDKISKLPQKMGDALKNNSKNLSNGMVEMWKAAVKASVAPVNKLLDGANHILKEFGSKKKVISWEPYARGTKGHRGGNALVNDGNGAELVQMPNGHTFIPRGRNVLIPNAPKGMKVMPADRTARLMGRKSATFNYANGVGNLDVWSFYDNAKGLIEKITSGISYDGMSRLAASMGEGMVSTFAGEMPAWVEKLFEESGQSIGSYVASKGVTQWLPTVVRALKMEGQYSLANVARTLFQMKTESGGNPKAINLWDSNAKKGIPSKGLMQVIDPTFAAYARDGFDKNIYDPLSNVLASVRYAKSRYGSLSKAYRGVGYSKGVGTVNLPTQGSMNLSYTPESDAEFYSSYTVEQNTYAPQFTANFYGASDDRTTRRNIKRWIAEAFDEMVDSMERSNPKVREV